MAVQWLHAAQAPVRPRHCTQALLQQPDQLILSKLLYSIYRALRRAASVSGDCLAVGFCAPAPVVGDGGVDLPRVSGIMASICLCGNRAKVPRDDVHRHHTTATFLRYHLMGVLGWLLAVMAPCRVMDPR